MSDRITLTQDRVVIADDERLIAGALAEVFAVHPRFRVVGFAASARDAVDVVRQKHPDLVILDYHLGDGPDGLAAIRNIRLATGTNMPAILVSGDPAEDHAEEARAGGIDLLQKPVAPARLRQVMRRLVPRQSGPDAPGAQPARAERSQPADFDDSPGRKSVA